MFDTAQQVEAQLLAGEDGSCEFKALRLTARGVQSPNAGFVAGEMVAFVNADGGALFLAVDDAGTPLGILRERLDAVERWLAMQEGRPSTDKPAYAIGVVDEAVVNAVAHRDYAIGVRPSRRITDSRDRRGIEERPCPSKPCG